VGNLVPMLLADSGYERIVAEQLQAVVNLDLHPVLIDVDLVKVFTQRFSLRVDSGMPESCQYLGSLATSIRLFDGAGKWLLQPTESLPVMAPAVPLSMQGKKISLFSPPSAWHNGCTSLAMMNEVIALRLNQRTGLTAPLYMSVLRRNHIYS